MSVAMFFSLTAVLNGFNFPVEFELEVGRCVPLENNPQITKVTKLLSLTVVNTILQV